jgi:hypothetical protein
LLDNRRCIKLSIVSIIHGTFVDIFFGHNIGVFAVDDDEIVAQHFYLAIRLFCVFPKRGKRPLDIPKGGSEK